MKSMTGFGRSETEVEGGRLIVEARSENHRFFDARIQIPEAVGFLEMDILRQLKKVALRGKVKITVIYERDSENSPEIDFRAARAVLENLKKLKSVLGLKGDITFDHILSFGDSIKKTPAARKLGRKKAGLIRRASESAIEKLDESKSREGKILRRDLILRTEKCKRVVRKIGNERTKHEKQIKRKLVETTRSLKGEDADEAKVYQEIVAVSEKSDITEEVVRMNSHLARFSEFISKSSVSVGKELDFLTQEMNREAGTISAKSKSTAISHLAVDLRSEIEKMREQVQNVE